MENININSGQVEIIGPFGRVYLYTHDYAKNLVAFVHESLSRRVRWDDPDYLSRIIFCSMIPYNEINNEQGFGIGTQLYVDIISSYGSGVDNIKMAIEDFVENFYKSAEF